LRGAVQHVRHRIVRAVDDCLDQEVWDITSHRGVVSDEPFRDLPQAPGLAVGLDGPPEESSPGNRLFSGNFRKSLDLEFGP
jgi:hypothetical protein